MTDKEAAIQETVDAFMKALRAGVDPDMLMRCIIQKEIDERRPKKRSV